MRRRDFLVGVGLVTAAWPVPGLAQRPPLPFVGFLSFGSPNEREGMEDAFRAGLREGGFVEGTNVAIVSRWAEGRRERLPHLAAELVKLQVAVIATSGGPAPALAAKAATKTIPIVFLSTADPVKLGLVPSLSHPDGNITGITSNLGSLDAKRVQIMAEMLPGAGVIAYLANPDNPGDYVNQVVNEVQAFAKTSGTPLRVVHARNSKEIEAAFVAIKKTKAKAVVVGTEGLFTTRREQVIELAERHAIPASYSRKEFVIDGGLMSYGTDYEAIYRQQGIYVARILKGSTPGDLPVFQSERFELVFNLRTANKLGLKIPDKLLVRADRVIR